MKNAYNTSAYGSFAYVYDIFMDNVPYEEWGEYILLYFSISYHFSKSSYFYQEF